MSGSKAPPASKSSYDDLLNDLRSLLAFAFPRHFFRFRGPSGLARVVAVAAFVYGVWQAATGILSASPFYSYDSSVLFIVASVPAVIAARIFDDE